MCVCGVVLVTGVCLREVCVCVCVVLVTGGLSSWRRVWVCVCSGDRGLVFVEEGVCVCVCCCCCCSGDRGLVFAEEELCVCVL